MPHLPAAGHRAAPGRVLPRAFCRTPLMLALATFLHAAPVAAQNPSERAAQKPPGPAVQKPAVQNPAAPAAQGRKPAVRNPPPAAGSSTAAESSTADSASHRLPAVTVTATPLRPALPDAAQPVTVLQGARLRDRQAETIGETVGREPGVHSSSFGPGVGRPILRGLDGPRVRVLEDGIGTLDASDVSADHAVGVEPLLADRVEILKGPATLLYGSGALGGVVNVLDGRIPEESPGAPLTGAAELRGASASDERTGVLRLDGGGERFAWHADAFRRRTHDYEIPGAAKTDDADAPDTDGGVLANSAVAASGGAVGASLLGERGFVGAALSRFETLYGVPGTGSGEAPVRIDLGQTRWDLKAALDAPLAGFESVRFRLGHNDYAHTEFEGDEAGTRFFNDAHEGRVEAVHAPLAGVRGAFGLQWSDADLRAVGEEAFLPPTTTRAGGLFWLGERAWGDFRLEVGARHDRQRVEARPGDDADASAGATDRDHHAGSLSAGGTWTLSPDYALKLYAARAQRAPRAEELFADGPHAATQTFEIGDPGLRAETSRNVDLTLHKHAGRLRGSLSVYHNRVADFIYLRDTGAVADGLPVRQWAQRDATFTGIEGEATLRLAEHAGALYELRLFGDRVRGRLDDGADLPRIPPARAGLGLDWRRGGLRAGVEALRVFQQDRVAAFETPTAGHTLLSANFSARVLEADAGTLEVFVRGSNLGDQEARNHTSFLKDVAPLPGRSLVVGLRGYF